MKTVSIFNVDFANFSRALAGYAFHRRVNIANVELKFIDIKTQNNFLKQFEENNIPYEII